MASDDRRTAPIDGTGGRFRLAHVTTVDMSLALLLGVELAADVEAGFEVYGISAPGPFVADVTALGVEHVPVPALTRTWEPRADARALRDLAAVLRRLRPHILHTHTPKAGVLGRIVGRALGVPVVVNTVHGLWAAPDAPMAKRTVVYAAEAFASTLSHAELYQNETDRRTLRRFVSPTKSRTVGNGVDLRRFRPDPAARDRVRRELGVRDNELVVGGVGRRVAEKGIREFAVAARGLSGRARCLWVGPDDEAKPDHMRTVDGPVATLGLRRDTEALYNAFDVFALPSYREGFSRSAMEAAATGCAMVLTDIRGCREIGRHEDELLLVPPRDAAALTAALERLLTDDALRRRLGTGARAHALAHFDQHEVAAASLATYRAVVRRKGLHWDLPAPPDGSGGDWSAAARTGEPALDPSPPA